MHFIVKLALIYNTAQRNVQRLGKQIKSTGLTFVAPGFITCITQINELSITGFSGSYYSTLIRDSQVCKAHTTLATFSI